MIDPIPESGVALHDRALENLRYIRRAMEGSGSFTAVPGRGGIGMGLVGLLAAWSASRRPDLAGWLGIWLGAAAVAAALGILASRRKARRATAPAVAGPARKFALAFAPAIVAGAVLTGALLAAERRDLLPGTWLLLYGTAVVSAGSMSVRTVPVLGVSFMALGVVALLGPADWGDALLAAGFGGLNVGFGAFIAWRHGG
ncbi:MAG: hypothetical protein ACE5HF_08150 [Gemmatimonadota bacterium]